MFILYNIYKVFSICKFDDSNTAYQVSRRIKYFSRFFKDLRPFLCFFLVNFSLVAVNFFLIAQIEINFSLVATTAIILFWSRLISLRSGRSTTAYSFFCLRQPQLKILFT